MKTLSTTLFSLVLGIASIGTVACSAGTGDVGSPAGEDPAAEIIAVDGPNARLAESMGIPETSLRAGAPLEMYLADQNATYIVESFELGANNDPTAGARSGSTSSGKLTLDAATIVVRPLRGNPALSRLLFLGGRTNKVVLRQPGLKKGAPATVYAELELAYVAGISTSLDEGGVRDTVTFEYGKLAVTRGKAAITVDRVTNRAECAEPCPCGEPGDAKLGPFVHGPDDTKLPKGATLIDSAEIAVVNEVTVASASTNAGAGKAALDTLTINGASDEQGACMIYNLAVGNRAPEMKIESGSTMDGKGGLVVDGRWAACGAVPTKVTLSMTAGGPMVQQTAIHAGGLISYGPDGKPSFGWSFTSNKQVATCAESNEL